MQLFKKGDRLRYTYLCRKYNKQGAERDKRVFVVVKYTPLPRYERFFSLKDTKET